MGWSAVAAVVAVIGTGYSITEQEKAKDKQKDAVQEQRKARNEQKAQNEAQAAQERRKQLREERIRRAKILSTSQAAGVTGSSGEIGALGGLSTQFATNLGSNLGALNSASNISLFSQNAANYSSAADQNNANAQMAGQVSSLAFQVAPVLSKAGSLFSASNPAPTTTTTPKA